MGRTTQAVNATLCKMQNGDVHKFPAERNNYVRRPHELNRWKLQERG
jgi:hypothetical protein